MCVCVCVCSCVYIVGQSNHMNKEIKSDTFKVNLGLKMEPLVVQKGKEGQDRFLQADVGILAQLWVSEQINACCCSVTKSCQTFCDSKDCSMPGSSVLCYLPDLLKFMSIESVMLSNHRSLCHPFLLLPSLFPNIRVFSNESALCISWLKYRSFSFSKSSSSEYSGLIFFMTDCFDLLAVQGTLKSPLQHHNSKTMYTNPHVSSWCHGP